MIRKSGYRFCRKDNRLAAAIVWKIGAGEGNRTLVISLEGCCSTIELHPRYQRLSTIFGKASATARAPGRHETASPGAAQALPVPGSLINSGRSAPLWKHVPLIPAPLRIQGN